MTDHGKISKKGLMTLELDDSGKYVTKTEGTGDPAKVGEQLLGINKEGGLPVILYNPQYEIDQSLV